MNYSNLVCHAIKGSDGIGVVYTANITLEQFCTFFDVADTDITEDEKMQRDTAKVRVSKISQYLTTRSNTMFPGVTCVTTDITFQSLMLESLNGSSEVGVLTLCGDAQRMLVDGQGRRLGTQEALGLIPELKSRTIDIKFVVTNTPTLNDAKTFIRQIFSDLHKRVVKPNSSINLFFDSSEVSSTFAVKAYEFLSKEIPNFSLMVSLEGNTSKIWTLAQFKTFLRNFTGLSDNGMNDCLDDPEMARMWLDLIRDVFLIVNDLDTFRAMKTLDDVKSAKVEHLLCCAIGIESIGILSNQIINRAITDQVPVKWDNLAKLSSINFDRKYERWIDCAMTSDGKIIKGSSKKIAASIACDLGIPLSREFMLANLR